MSVTPAHASAPGGLELVRQFVNTLDIEAGTDHLESVAAYRSWAFAQPGGANVSNADLDGARNLREALRRALHANHQQEPLPEETVKALNAASELAQMTVRFASEGPRLVPAATGAAALAGSIVAAVADAMADSTWQRLKACSSDACQWAFYDNSRSRTGQWCSMNICGNRAKQARYRAGTRTERNVVTDVST